MARVSTHAPLGIHRWVATAAALLLALMACQPGAPATPTESPPTPPPPTPALPTDQPTPEPTPPPEPTATPSGAVSRLEDVRSAVVQIEAVGSFVDPEVGEVQNAAGLGSGFLIDPSGLIVTNNHVVTGGALLKVWVGGESSPRNAIVLGVSECSDLAVIKIEGNDYPYLEWYTGTITPGLDIYVAGYPLGDPEYTLTRGIVAKERAEGNTSWASVPYVLQHDASTNPGSSGGPLVTADGKIVGVHYAAAREVTQQFAISRDTVVPLLADLQADLDVTSIGVNGIAVSDGAGTSGIWVYSVASGSPADMAGIRGGDIITELEHVTLSSDGTMSDYCGILRSHRSSDVLAVRVLRFATQEVLDGQLNGRELTTTFSFADELGGDPAVPPAPEYTDYTAVTDDLDAIVVSVPVEWLEVDGTPWQDNEGTNLGAMITAAPSIYRFDNAWGPGLRFAAGYALREWTVDSLLDSYIEYQAEGECEYVGRFDYEDPVFTGKYDYYTSCGGTNVAGLVLVSEPADASYLTVLFMNIASEADFAAADRALNTFNVIGDLP
jgi:serine protease Do